MEELRKIHKNVIGNPDEKILRGRPKNRWEVNIKMYVKEKWRGNLDWIKLSQDTLN
jgi:hypothetical protein